MADERTLKVMIRSAHRFVNVQTCLSRCASVCIFALLRAPLYLFVDVEVLFVRQVAKC